MTNESPIYTPWRHLLGVVLVASLAVGLLLVAFAWPATNLAPRGVPLAVAGPAPAVQQLTAAFDRQQPGAFEIAAVADEGAARDLIADREVYGAVVLSPQAPPTVLIAPAASPVVAQLLTQAAGSLGEETPASRVVDVAPLPEGDGRGAGLAAGSLPLALGGLAVGAILAFSVAGAGRRAAGAVGVAVLAGPLAVGVLHGWLGALSGDRLAESAVVSLGLGATAFAVLGLHAILGRVGVALGAAVIMLLGNPLSAANAAPELLPEGWGALGQMLPPGALVNALRGVSGFDGAAVTLPVLVLIAWVAAGALLLGLGGLRARRSVPDVVETSAPVPAPV